MNTNINESFRKTIANGKAPIARRIYGLATIDLETLTIKANILPLNTDLVGQIEVAIQKNGKTTIRLVEPHGLGNFMQA